MVTLRKVRWGMLALISVNDIGCSKSTKVLENAPLSSTDVVYVETLAWIVGCTSEWMRLNEDL